MGDKMSDPLYVFLFIFAFITSGILLNQLGDILYDVWEDWKKNGT